MVESAILAFSDAYPTAINKRLKNIICLEKGRLKT